MVELSGAEIVVQALKDEGVEYVFGYPGGAVLHIYDAIFREEAVKHILVRHEQGAVHAADDSAGWIARLRHELALTDAVRLDHCRGFAANSSSWARSWR